MVMDQNIVRLYLYTYVYMLEVHHQYFRLVREYVISNIYCVCVDSGLNFCTEITLMLMLKNKY